RFVSLIAVSAWSLEQPKPTILSGCPATEPPLIPADGLFGFFGLAPANCANAAIAPPMSASYWLPNAPWQSDRMPILIVDAVALPEAVAARTPSSAPAVARAPSPARSESR